MISASLLAATVLASFELLMLLFRKTMALSPKVFSTSRRNSDCFHFFRSLQVPGTIIVRNPSGSSLLSGLLWQYAYSFQFPGLPTIIKKRFGLSFCRLRIFSGSVELNLPCADE